MLDNIGCLNEWVVSGGGVDGCDVVCDDVCDVMYVMLSVMVHMVVKVILRI